MRLKGETLIQLTNVKTGEVEEYRHENFVTEFASEYFRECGGLNTNPLGSIQDALPIDDLFGGIMLFDKKIDQNTDDTGNHPHPLYCPAGTKMTANGSVDINRNSNATELGQYDSTESGTPNERQRVYVYNWDTDEGNGKINSVCLTTKAGGYIGAGNATSGVADSQSGTESKRMFAYSGTGIGTRTFVDTQYPRLAGLDLSQGQVALLASSAKDSMGAGSVTVNWYDVPVSKLQPFISKLAFNESVLTARRTQTKTFTARSVTYARVMGGMGYILMVGVASGTAITNGSTVYAVQLNKDGTVTEKSYTISSIANNIPLNSTDFIGGKIIGNDLYLAYGSLTGSGATFRFRIKGDNSTVKFDTTDQERLFFVNEGRVYAGTQHYFDTVSGEMYVNNAAVWTAATTWDVGLWQCYDSPLVFCIKGTQTTALVGQPLVSPLSVLRPPCNWLSTINNLQNELEKTAEKTMKVTYTLTLT